MTDRHRTPGDQLLGALLEASHSLTPDRLAPAVAHHAAQAGFGVARLLLVDLEQRVLVDLTDGEVYEIDGTMAGRAFRRTEQVDVEMDGGWRLLVPLIDGTERLGVLAVTVHETEISDDTRALAGHLASLVALIIVSKSSYGDSLHHGRRRKHMTLAAELRWSMLPPLTFVSPQVSVAGVLEPAYEVAGDSFDYAIDDGDAYLAIVDAMGHGLEASRMANLAIAAFRHSRRHGLSLEAAFLAMDGALSDQFGVDQFVTGQLAHLDTRTGRLHLLNAGHPAPMLLRHGRNVSDIGCDPCFPIGFGNTSATIHEVPLEPGDRVLFLTDGVVEARSPDGEPFGRERLGEFLVRRAADQQTLPETMRGLSHAILAHQQGELQDDATLLLLEWPGPPA